MRGTSVEVWLGDGEIHELEAMRRQARTGERRRRLLALGRWIAELRARLVHAG